MIVGRSTPRYHTMTLLYPRSKNLQSSLSEYFIVVVRLCHQLLRLTQKSKLGQLMSFLSEPEMTAYRSDLELWANSIKEEVNLLMAQGLEEQSSRVKALSAFSKSKLHRKMHLRILDSCSTSSCCPAPGLCWQALTQLPYARGSGSRQSRKV